MSSRSALSATAPAPRRPGRWGRHLLPAILGAEDALPQLDGGSDLPRSLRDWVADLVLFGGAALIGLGACLSDLPQDDTSLLVLDATLGLVACAALWWRRRRPEPVGWCLIALAAVSDCALGAALVGLVTVAVHCAPRRTAAIAAAAPFAGFCSTWLLYPDARHGVHSLVLWCCGLIAAIAVGLYVRSRRELLLSLRERALRAEEQQHLRVRDAQLSERARIAREMHDVLAHRISLLSLHAGALEYNPGASPAQLAQAAAVIRQNARAAQEELREVIGVLRTGEGSEQLAPPQPTQADLDGLIAETRAAGVSVHADVELAAAPLGALTARTLYRVLQEALTNVRKHAPADVVAITLTTDGDGVTLEVVNRPRAGGAHEPADDARTDHAPSGLGLVGLAERVSLAGGGLDAAPLGDGGFQLRARLPLGRDGEA